MREEGGKQNNESRSRKEEEEVRADFMHVIIRSPSFFWFHHYPELQVGVTSGPEEQIYRHDGHRKTAVPRYQQQQQ